MNPTESVSPATTDGSSRSRPMVRRRLRGLALGILALAIGYYAGQVWRRWSRVANAPPPAAKTESPAKREVEFYSLTLRAFDPDAPLPATVKELTEEVLVAVKELTEAFPGIADAWEVRARAEQWQGNSSQAVRMWEECLKRDAKYVYALVGQASVAADRAEHERAAELAEKAVRLDPRNFQARAVLADALLQLGRAAEVPGVLEDFLKTDPRSQGHFLLGQAFAQTNQFGQARDNYEAAIRIYPDYVEAYSGLAQACERLGDAAKAKQALETFRRLGSPEKSASRIRGATVSDLELLRRGAATLYNDAGRLFFTQGYTPEAEVLWLRAAALDSNNVECRQSLAWLTRHASRPGETIGWLNQLAVIDPKNPSYWLESGRMYEKLSLLPAAEEAYRQVCEAFPESDVGHAAVADLLVRYGQNLGEALERARKAVEIRPSAANYAVLAAASRVNGDRAAALRAIEQAISLAPEDARYRALRDAMPAK